MRHRTEPAAVVMLRWVTVCICGFALFVALWMIAGAAVAQGGSYRLLIDGEDCGGINVAVPLEVSRSGDVSLATIDGVQCGLVGPPCGAPDGFRILDQVTVERNNFENITGKTFEAVFGAWPGDGGAYRIRLNRFDVISLPVTVPESAEVVRLTFEGNTDIAASTTVAISACAGGTKVPVSETCGKSFGESGTTFIFGANAVEQRCALAPGDYFLVIGQHDELGEPGCGDDQICTVFFGLDALIGGGGR